MARNDEERFWPWAVAVVLAVALLMPHRVLASEIGGTSVSPSTETSAPRLVAQRTSQGGSSSETREMMPLGPAEETRRGAPATHPVASPPAAEVTGPVTPAAPIQVEPQVAPEAVRGATQATVPEVIRSAPPVETRVPRAVESRIPTEARELQPEEANAPRGVVEVPRGALPGAGPEALPAPPPTSQGSPERPGYFSSKLLNEQDFKKEQEYSGQRNPIGMLYKSMRPVPTGPAALPPVAAIPPPGSTKMLEGLHRDMAQNQPLVEALGRHGAPPTPEGLGRMVGLAERYPEEFKELAARTARASKDPKALGEVEEALQAFFSKGAVKPGEWGELGYVVARLIQEDKAEPDKGKPIFQKPLLVSPGPDHPKDKDGEKETEEWFKDLEGGEVSGLFPGVEDLDKTLEGRGKDVSWGDGIQGITDVGEKPDAGLPDPGGVPQVPLNDTFEKGGIPDPSVGGAKEPYGGININIARQGQTADDNPVDEPGAQGQTHSGSTTEKEVYKDVLGATKAGEKVTEYHYKDENGIVNEHAIIIQGKKGFTLYNYKDGKWTFWTYMESESGGMVGPGGEGSEMPPHQEPQILMRAEKEGVGQQKESSHAAPITDPMPVRDTQMVEAGPSGGESQGATGPSGSQGTEQKWKFAGKKPGSEVTDYPETGGPPGEPELNVKRDLSQVTDPAETQSGLAVKGASVSPAMMRQQTAHALAPIFARLLVGSVRQAGESQQVGQAAQAHAGGAGEAPSGPAPEGPPPTGGGGAGQ